MPNTGIPQTTSKLLASFFKKTPFLQKVVLFGSRAIGTYKNGSDIDIAVAGDFNTTTFGMFKLDLADLDTPFLFDVLDLARISSDELKEHIQKNGVVLYEKDSLN